MLLCYVGFKSSFYADMRAYAHIIILIRVYCPYF